MSGADMAERIEQLEADLLEAREERNAALEQVTKLRNELLTLAAAVTDAADDAKHQEARI